MCKEEASWVLLPWDVCIVDLIAMSLLAEALKQAHNLDAAAVAMSCASHPAEVQLCMCCTVYTRVFYIYLHEPIQAPLVHLLHALLAEQPASMQSSWLGDWAVFAPAHSQQSDGVGRRPWLHSHQQQALKLVEATAAAHALWDHDRVRVRMQVEQARTAARDAYRNDQRSSARQVAWKEQVALGKNAQEALRSCKEASYRCQLALGCPVLAMFACMFLERF